MAATFTTGFKKKHKGLCSHVNRPGFYADSVFCDVTSSGVAI